MNCVKGKTWPLQADVAIKEISGRGQSVFNENCSAEKFFSPGYSKDIFIWIEKRSGSKAILYFIIFFSFEFSMYLLLNCTCSYQSFIDQASLLILFIGRCYSYMSQMLEIVLVKS